MQRLTVSDRRGVKINLEYQLEGFDRLRDSVVANTKTNREQRFQRRLEFQKDRRVFDVLAMIGAVLFVILACVCFREDKNAHGYFFILLAVALPLTSISVVESRVELTTAGIVVRYPLTKRLIRFAEITDIQLRNERVARGNSIAMVRVLRAGQKAPRPRGVQRWSHRVARGPVTSLAGLESVGLTVTLKHE